MTGAPQNHQVAFIHGVTRPRFLCPCFGPLSKRSFFSYQNYPLSIGGEQGSSPPPSIPCTPSMLLNGCQLAVPATHPHPSTSSKKISDRRALDLRCSGRAENWTPVLPGKTVGGPTKPRRVAGAPEVRAEWVSTMVEFTFLLLKHIFETKVHKKGQKWYVWVKNMNIMYLRPPGA